MRSLVLGRLSLSEHWLLLLCCESVASTAAPSLMALEGGGFCSRFDSSRRRGRALRLPASRNAAKPGWLEHRDELHLDAKGAPRAALRVDGWPRQSTDIWLDRQPTEGVNPALHPCGQRSTWLCCPQAQIRRRPMSTARTETRTSSWRTPTLRGLRQSLSVTRRTKPSVEEPLQLDANGLRKALQIGSDLIASPIVDHVRQQRAWDCGLACVLMAAPHVVMVA